MKLMRDTVIWEIDTLDEADDVVTWVKIRGGNAYVAHLTQMVMGIGPAFQVNITNPDRIVTARAGDLISHDNGRFTVHKQHEAT